MRNFDESNITAAVLARLVHSASPRSREISSALVRHLHAFVREIEPSQAEWEAAIDFLTRTGQTCSDTRQEFILLSDALGVSMLVDAINHRLPGQATETTVLGPFYVHSAPEHELGADISGGMPGEPLLVEGTVRDLDGRPLVDAVVDSWNTDGDGFYDVQRDAGLARLAGRARFPHRRGGAVLVQDRGSRLLPDPRRWPGGRHAEDPGTPPVPPGPRALHGGPSRVRNPGHPTFSSRVTPTSTPTSCSASRTR